MHFFVGRYCWMMSGKHCQRFEEILEQITECERLAIQLGEAMDVFNVAHLMVVARLILCW